MTVTAPAEVDCGTGATCADVAAPGTGYTCSCTGAGLSGADTTDEAATCSPVLCAKNEAVTDNACVACASGKTRKVGDDASSGNTACTTPPAPPAASGAATAAPVIMLSLAFFALAW